MAKPVKIILAMNSPLYAPVILAVMQGWGKARNVQLQIASPPRAKPKFHADGGPSDPFIRQVLSWTDVKNTVMVGIGDPMRLASIPKSDRVCAEAAVVGVLVRHMCYWLIDHPTETENHWADHFETVLVHPAGMTGYTVPCHYLLTSKWKHHRIKEMLQCMSDPSNDLDEYRNALKAKQAGIGPTRTAFITTNPSIAIEGQRYDGDLKTFLQFASECAYQDVVMTGIITAQHYMDDKEGDAYEIIMSLLETVSQTVEIIYNDPLSAACVMYRHFEDKPNLLGEGTSPFFGLTGPRQLGEVFRTLSHLEAYPTSQLLSVPGTFVDNTIQIRALVEPLLPPHEIRRKAITLRDRFTLALAEPRDPSCLLY